MPAGPPPITAHVVRSVVATPPPLFHRLLNNSTVHGVAAYVKGDTLTLL